MTAPRLYFRPGTRAVRARWMLEELGVDYDLTHVDFGKADHKKPDYLRVHPFGKVPALEIDGAVLTESLAICLYLTDRYWERDLAPVNEEYALRADYLTWMAFSTGTLEPALLEQARIRKARSVGNVADPPFGALAPWADVAAHFERTLKGRDYLMGGFFTAADIMNGSIMMWAQSMGIVSGHSRIENWLERLSQRAAYGRAAAPINPSVP